MLIRVIAFAFFGWIGLSDCWLSAVSCCRLPAVATGNGLLGSIRTFLEMLSEKPKDIKKQADLRVEVCLSVCIAF
jgi:hypothetical protein